jgi:hypothetical protein
MRARNKSKNVSIISSNVWKRIVSKEFKIIPEKLSMALTQKITHPLNLPVTPVYPNSKAKELARLK